MAKKILLIEDDKIFSKILRDGLKTKGRNEYDIVNAYDGEEGFAKAQEERPDIIVSDLMMPKVDGMEFIKKMKDDEELSNIPILVSTQVPDMDKIGEAISLGVKGYIIKSDYSLEDIVKKIDDTLDGK